MPRARSPAKQNFRRQGALILLPAILLAGFGIFSLRQDRMLAEFEASRQADEIAGNIAETFLSSVLDGEAPSFEAIDNFQRDSGRAEAEPLFKWAHANPPVLACLVDPELELLYPPPVSGIPAPRPLDAATLGAESRALWESARRAAYVEDRADRALVFYERFLDGLPPPEFAAAALYEAGVLAGRAGAADHAAEWLEQLIARFPGAIGESGFPLQPFAERHLIELAGDVAASAPRAWLESLCAGAVLRPSPMSALLLDQAQALETGAPMPAVSRAWRDVWETHETARRMHREWVNAPVAAGDGEAADGPGFWTVLRGDEPHFVYSRTHSDRRWIMARPESALQQLASRFVEERVMSADYGVSMELAGLPITKPPAGSPVLGAVSMPLGEGSDLALAVRVYLLDPAGFYARQRTRTRWFGSLIALSGAAVFAGFFSAWRAFRDQQALGELKSNFVSSVSHEMRAPIAAVSLMAEELEDHGGHDRRKQKEYHQLMLQECRRLSALIENVLDFSRHEQGRKEYEFEPVNLAGLLRQTVKVMGHAAEARNVRLELCAEALAAEDWEPVLDGRAVQQALVNLIDNAIKHSASGKTIRVGFDAAPAGAESARSADGAARTSFALWVADEGEGIPAEEHERIFERFYRRGSELRRETQGIGLGLAIVRHVAEAHGGRVRVDSAPGSGSRFTMELPFEPMERRGMK